MVLAQTQIVELPNISHPYSWCNWKEINQLLVENQSEVIENGIHINLTKIVELNSEITALAQMKPKQKLSNPILRISELISDKTPFIASTILYLWNGICFSPIPDSIYTFTMKLCDLFGFKYSERFAWEIEQSLIRRYRLPDNGVYILNQNTNLIPFKNGYYDITTKTLLKPDPKYYFTYFIDHNYNPTADCPQFKQYLEQVLSNNPTTLYRTKVLTYIAYCFTSSVSLQKAQLWYGSGNNGKTVLFNLLELIFKGVITSLGLQELSKDFQKVILRDKLINYNPDLPSTRLDDEGVFKQCITDFNLYSDEKYSVRAHWHNTTKHIYGCNRIPLPPKDPTKAYWRRWDLVEFEYEFKNKTDPDFDPKKHREAKDIILLTKQLEDEIEGIIPYLLSFLDQMDLIRKTDVDKIRKDWYNHSDNSMQFIMECDTSDFSSSIPCAELYTAYKTWCFNNKLAPQTAKRFGMNLSEQGISSRRQYVDGAHIFIYEGIRLKVDLSSNATSTDPDLDAKKLTTKTLKAKIEMNNGLKWSEILQDQQDCPDQWVLEAPKLYDLINTFVERKILTAIVLENDIKYEKGPYDFPKELLS